MEWRFAQFAAGTCALLHVCAWHCVTWERLAATSFLGLPVGVLVWHGLPWAVRLTRGQASAGLQEHIKTLLDAGHRAGAPGQDQCRACACAHAWDDGLPRRPSLQIFPPSLAHSGSWSS